jgi:hypothetical protein
MAMPGGLAAQTIGQGVIGAGQEALKGSGPLSIAAKGAEGAGGALLGAGIGKGIGKAATAIGGLKSYSNTIGDQLAAKLKEIIPAYSKFEPTVQGLKEMLYGSGEKALHTAYEKSLNDVVAKGAGQVIHVPVDAAEKLGLNNAGAGVAGLPANVQALFNKGAQKAGMTPAGTPGMIGVDAAEAAKAMVGKSGTPEYRAVANALDEANSPTEIVSSQALRQGDVGVVVDDHQHRNDEVRDRDEPTANGPARRPRSPAAVPQAESAKSAVQPTNPTRNTQDTEDEDLKAAIAASLKDMEVKKAIEYPPVQVASSPPVVNPPAGQYQVCTR